MLRINEHLISYLDSENSESAFRDFSLENCNGFTVLGQGNTANTDTLTFRLWAKLPLATDLELANLIANATSPSAGLTTTYTAPDRWVLIREDVVGADTTGDGNPGWAVTDTLAGYKTIRVTVSSNVPEVGLFVSVILATVTNK